jgi:hypothetical protein
MTLQNGLKAGAIGAVVAVVLTLVGLVPIPFLGCCTFLFTLVLWAGVGLLAGYFGSQSNPAQTGGQAAQAGAVAGAITALAGGLVQTIVSAIQMAMGGAVQALSQIPPDQLRQLQEAGIDPAILGGAGGVAAIIGCCCIVGPLLAAGLGALGGAVAPSFFKPKPPAAPPVAPPIAPPPTM